MNKEEQYRDQLQWKGRKAVSLCTHVWAIQDKCEWPTYCMYAWTFQLGYKGYIYIGPAPKQLREETSKAKFYPCISMLEQSSFSLQSTAAPVLVILISAGIGFSSKANNCYSKQGRTLADKKCKRQDPEYVFQISIHISICLLC